MLQLSEYSQNALFEFYNKETDQAIKRGNKLVAQELAFEWLSEYKSRLCISIPWNWKIAKKQIVDYYFNKPCAVQITLNDNIERGVEFIMKNLDKRIRCSYHKYDTACHSESRNLDESNLSWLVTIYKQMTSKDVIVIFVESSSSSTVCFRRFSLQYNEEVSYEMGYGQAMYVFETERGFHDTASINIIEGSRANWNSTDMTLSKHLDSLISNHETILATKTENICYFMGLPQICIEGYFNIKTFGKPIIVDIDIPFDKAFF